MENKVDNPVKKKLPLGVIAAAIAAVIIIASILIISATQNQGREKKILIASTLEKIVDVSQLSTFSAVYNGIAQVADPKDSEKTEYYVAYEAKVNAGIDFEKIGFEVDDEKTIHVRLPAIQITKVNVDIASMDYIFIDSKKNTTSVSAEAYKACEADAQTESEKEAAILELAKQNAENVIKALIEPFVEQLDAEYTLEIDWEEGR